MMALLPIVLDMTILHVAVPSLTLDLQASGTQVLWIIDIYPSLMASLLIPMGTLAAAHSIGETMITANALGGDNAQQLMAAGQAAFSASHSLVLLTAAGLIGVMSGVVWHVLRRTEAR
uniref:hypothetical protein n=1 Tax=Pseudomonas asturiensis TaxID=1190415 RepID=UPI001F2E3572|nr:hypothetical protein [Pseudomonas asturiensis]